MMIIVEVNYHLNITDAYNKYELRNNVFTIMTSSNHPMSINK